MLEDQNNKEKVHKIRCNEEKFKSQEKNNEEFIKGCCHKILFHSMGVFFLIGKIIGHN
jgi:hypothetical protein